jgi:hypothetical protein
MKWIAAFVLALALFAAPALAVACEPKEEWKGPALTEIFDKYEETILFGGG